MREADLGKAKILVVEDEVSMAALLKKGLEDQYYSVTVAHSGNEGLDLARRGDFAAIILDVLLPGMDGQTLTMVLRAENNQTPIIMLTARDSMENIAGGLDAGAEDYLTKPFSFIELLARLRSLVRRAAKPLPEVLGRLCTGCQFLFGGDGVPPCGVLMGAACALLVLCRPI